MSVPPVWSVRNAITRIHGCELAVTWRPDCWTWVVTVAGEQVASGKARSQDGAQDAAVLAARRHADDGGKIQLPLL
ncbi:hypothetical protein [Azospirillum picis]|uniref:DRBM domain-containing protein n=1 Tax=Azospirillum picis TaxID=488438 RepID=A0ABU0MDV4_9PROT|nr:hypothetical protein [Azospirillum picis]MBP2297357.1 hypothetical protein [Azospirillum picis]MDQ0531620.1 hypothetical protein [Azospirillum picis]